MVMFVYIQTTVFHTVLLAYNSFAKYNLQWPLGLASTHFTKYIQT